jgi:hypothetical protein
MEYICITLPVLAGKSQNARDFMQELELVRKQAYHRSEQRIGIVRELWWLASLNSSEYLIAYMESGDFAGALGAFSQSQDEFDLWFKQHMLAVTGVDLNDPPEISLPELLSNYDVKDMHAAVQK